MTQAETALSDGLPPFLTSAAVSAPPADADLLAQASPAIDTALAAEIAQRHYGISGEVKTLTAEKDANFLLRLPSGEAALLKITNAAEDRAVTDMQTAALMHLAATDPSLPVQRICRSLNGNPCEIAQARDGQSHVVRLMTFLEGTVLSNATPRAGLFHALGDFHARVTLGLRGFFHPAAGHFLQWDIKQAAHLRPMLSAVQDPDLRAQLDAILDRFDAEVAPRLPHLRAQVVHNDFNPHNLLVDGVEATHPVGLIDFGDMVHTPIVCDLAVACSYHIAEGSDPLGAMCEMVAGYAARLPLEAEEIALLPLLIRLRHATTLAIGATRAERYCENADYILRNAAAAERGLAALNTLGDEAAITALHNAAQKE